MKRQKDTTSENESQGQTVSNMLLGKSIGQVQIVPEKMKQLSQSGNNPQLWICPMEKVKSDGVKNNIA